MNRFILIILIFFSANIFAQNNNIVKSFGKEYDELMNYIPVKEVFSKTETINKNKQKYSLKSIADLSLYCYVLSSKKIFIKEKQWLINRINNLVKGLYLDGKRILISKVGGYSGCPDKMIDSFKLNNIEIIDLKFCHGCTDWSNNSFFIKTFNDKMFNLMKIKPPDSKTSLFKGIFINKKRGSDYLKLVLNNDRTFNLLKLQNSKKVIQNEIWENNKYELILNISKDEKVKLLLKDEKLINLDDIQKIKLKKMI